MIGETKSSTGTLEGLTQVNISVDTNDETFQYELPLNNVNIFDRNFVVVRTPKIEISKSKKIAFSINSVDCITIINR